MPLSLETEPKKEIVMSLYLLCRRDIEKQAPTHGGSVRYIPAQRPIRSSGKVGDTRSTADMARRCVMGLSA